MPCARKGFGTWNTGEIKIFICARLGKTSQLMQLLKEILLDFWTTAVIPIVSWKNGMASWTSVVDTFQQTDYEKSCFFLQPKSHRCVVLTVVFFFIRHVDGETRVGVFASRAIEPREPLTYDYRYWLALHRSLVFWKLLFAFAEILFSCFFSVDILSINLC